MHDSKDYIVKKFLKNLKEIVEDTETSHKVAVLMIDNSKEDVFANWVSTTTPYDIVRNHWKLETGRLRQCACLNEIRRCVIENKFDLLFSLEADILPNKDIIYHLIEAMQKNKADACSAVYLLNHKRGIPCLTKKIVIANNNTFPAVMHPLGYVDGEIKEIENGAGLGCVLIKRNVLEKIKFRSERDHADTYFWHDFHQYKFKGIVDCSQIAKHYPGVERK